MSWQERQSRLHEGAARSASDRASDAQPATVFNPLALLSTRVFADSSGRAVVVGEVQNVTSSTLSFPEVHFAFFNAAGALVGTDWTYVTGSENRRLQLSGIFVSALPPGAVGFFKLWTPFQLSGLQTYSFASEAETYATTSARTSLALSGPITLSPNFLGGTDYAFMVANGGTATVAYFAQASVAGYLNGALNDVGFSYADGTSITQCGVTTDTALRPGAVGLIDYFFLRPVTSINRLTFEWDEVSVAPNALVAGPGGGSAVIQVYSQCSWTAVSNVPWISVTSGASGSRDGTVTITAMANSSGGPRTGAVTIAGLTVTVEQSGDGVAPVITSHPAGVTVSSGQSASLSVAATGSVPLIYQWFVGPAGTTTNPIAGATASTYATPALSSTTSYWVRVSNAAGSANSNTATVTVLTPFTDPVLISGVTPPKVVHITELRARIDALRARFGLAPFAWTDAVLTPGVAQMRSVHITELRAALGQAYVSAGVAAPSYTDPTLTPGVTPMRAAHVMELRAAVMTIE